MDKLIASNISKSYEGVATIKNVSIVLKDGELVCLLGASGVGKTTFFNILSGLYAPDSGSVTLNGNDITGQAGHIAYMLQKDLLLPYYSILDNVSLPLIIRGINKKEAYATANQHFHKFGLDGTQTKYPNQLSGGMRQRAALLRTYMFSNDVALLDEPFSALDTITKGHMHSWYLSIMSEIKLSTLFITHDVDEAILLSDRIYIMGGHPGEIIAEIVIEENKPRNNDFNLTNDFIIYKKKILSLLNS